MVLSEASATLIADLNLLHKDLKEYGIKICQLLRCVNPEFCGTDAAEDCLIPGEDKQGRRVTVIDDKIHIFDPRARDQRSFLFGRAREKAASKRFNCRDCRFAGITCPIAEDSPYEDEDGPRTRREVLTAPADPLELYSQNVLIEKFNELFPKEEERQALKWLIEGRSQAWIARRQQKKHATVRKQISRAREKLAPLFGLKFRPRGNR